MSGPPLWVEKYMGVPFRYGGRDARGLDCWGLVRLVLREQGAVEVPSYGEVSARDRAAVAMTMSRESLDDIWLPVPINDLRELDVVTMLTEERRNGVLSHLPDHVGIVAGGDHILHIERAAEVTCVPVRRLARRIQPPARRHHQL